MGIRKINKAIDKVNAHIAQRTDQSSIYSRGLAREGYLGGYLQALSDVLAVLRKTPVSHKTGRYWLDKEDS